MKAVSYTPVEITPKRDLLDRAGIFLSGLCLIHCTVLPLALAALQAYGASLAPKTLDNGWFHAGLAFVLLGVGGLAFVQGYRRHGRMFPLAAGAVGTGLLFIGAFGAGLPEFAEHGFTIAGTLTLLLAHAKNRRSPWGLAGHVHDESCLGKA